MSRSELLNTYSDSNGGLYTLKSIELSGNVLATSTQSALNRANFSSMAWLITSVMSVLDIGNDPGRNGHRHGRVVGFGVAAGAGDLAPRQFAHVRHHFASHGGRLSLLALDIGLDGA